MLTIIMPDNDIISELEVAKMIESCDELRFKAMIATLWATGHRISEILDLKTTDIYSDKKWIYFTFNVLKRKKKENGERTNYIHTIKVPRELSFTEYILLWKDECKEEMLFDFTRQYAFLIIKRLNPAVHPHQFRHTLATKFAERGANKYEMDAWFGWTGWGTSDKYVQKGTALIENIANRMR